MNPPEPVNPEYDRGYAAGYHDRGLEQVVIDMREIKNVKPEDFEYLARIVESFPPTYRKLLEIKH